MNCFVIALLLVALTGMAPSAAQQRPARGAKPVATTTMESVNLNSATAAQIAALPGIGQKTAELIIQYRQKNGPFKKIEEVMNVRGIGEKSFLRIKDRLTVAPSKGE